MNTNTTDPDPQTLIAQVISYYARYLSASPEHLDLLALWTLHTHCFQGASFSPALHITSRHKQSGKTLCLHLLNDLCRDPWLHASPSPALVTRQTQGRTPGDSFDGTLLLDDCRIGTRLSGVLTASFCWEGTQIVLGKDYRGNPDFDRRKTFFPKAIVTRDRLPESLKETSIPLALEPKAPGSPCRRYKYSDEASELCQSLQQTLGRWGLENFDRVSQMASSYEESQFPPEFSSRQQDCAEPLLQVAELIGGEWPQRARNALINIFALSAFGDFFSSRQILSDLRDAFTAKNNPEWISTADLLEFLHAMDDRAWDDWNKGKPMNPKDLAALLKPFGLGPANHRTESGKVIKGYKLQHLEPSWARHLPNSKIPVPQQPTCGTERQAISPATTDDTGAHTEAPVSAERQKPLPPEKNFSDSTGEELLGGDNPVAANLQKSSTRILELEAGSQQPEAPVAANSQNPTDIIGRQPDPVLRCPPKEAGSQQLLVAANLQKSSTGILELDAGSQHPEAPVAANPQNRLGYIYGEELVEANIRSSKARLQ